MIRGKDIILRAVELSDAKILFDWENNQELWHLSGTRLPYSMYDIEQYVLNAGSSIESTGQYRFIITNQTDIIGIIDLFDYELPHRRAGVGILINEKFRNMGYAADALNLLCNHCFGQLDFNQLWATIGTDNISSLSLFKKVGFKENGIKEKWTFYNGKLHDEYFLQLINPKHR